MSSIDPTDGADQTTEAETYGDYSVDDEDQMTAEDTLGDGSGGTDGVGSDVEDELDRGYSPAEQYSAGQGFGNTPYEEATGETLDQRVAQEVPEPDPYEQAEAEAARAADPDGATDIQGPGDVDGIVTGIGEGADDLEVGEVGDERAGRLVDPDEGLSTDTEKDLVGDDVGIDGAASSAEEAAVHVVPDDEPI